jgi:putative CocE/NonD family hydrolase
VFTRELLGVDVHHDVMVPMRDGTRLAADLYLPGGAPRPALLLRTPYNKRNGEAEGYANPAWYGRHGFAVVAQDVRGAFASEGDLDPFTSEAADGYDTIEWVASQPWCDGRVMTYGFSYPGATQLLAAAASPPHLLAMAPAMTGSSYHEGWTYHGGALQLAFVISWALGLGRDRAMRARDREAVAGFDRLLEHPMSTYAQLPIRDAIPEPLSRYTPFFSKWLDHPDYDGFWRSASPKEHYTRMRMPALHIAGWYDIFLEGTLENYRGMAEHAPSQRLLVGPWSHMLWGPVVGECDFGQEARNLVDEAQLAFFTAVVNDGAAAVSPAVRIFVMGENRWRDLDRWPPSGGNRAPLYLHSDGRAQSLNGTGRLAPAPEPSQAPDVIVSDPNLPVLSLGGRASASDITPMGPADQRPQEARNDVLVFSSDPFTVPTTIIGYPAAELFLASDTPSADIVVRLADVHPDGRAINVCDGNRRLPFRPGTVEQVTIDLSPTAVTFQPGHRIRLEVTGSNFPALDRNPGTGASAVETAAWDARPATQIVFHDQARPSRVILPMAEQSG